MRLLHALDGLEGVTLHDLYERYPDLEIDPRREQELLADNDAIVFQHPFYWYSVPAILKQWQDLVLTHGWAYGAKGHALDGKLTFNVLTSGGPETSYCREGLNHFTVRELLAPWEATANLCRMVYLAPFVVHGTHLLTSEGALEKYVADYRRVLIAVRDEAIDVPRAAAASRINASLEAVMAS